MIFLTYNDSPSGIYFSQVTDVCKFLNQKLDANVQLVSIISIRNYLLNRRKIKSELHDAIVLPMVPKLRNWKLNFYLLVLFFLFRNEKKVIARGPFAVSIALWLKKMGLVKWVCFDARGAYDAELNEYDVVNDDKIKKDIFNIEKNAIINSDFRIAVSNELVNYWMEKFGYNVERHVVIPCTLNSNLFKTLPTESIINEKRKELGFTEEDIVLVYSGSSAGWQSLKLADEFLYNLMTQNKNVKVLFLVKSLPENMKIVNRFKNRIVFQWLQEDIVPIILSCCDYGILIREKSITNKVASPVKFAEYLSCGLKIIISEEVGDYSDFVKIHNCGFIFKEIHHSYDLERVRYKEKNIFNQLALEKFSKLTFESNYRKILS